MLQDTVSIIGIGQCGNNITRELELLGMPSVFYINSSLDDLDTIETLDENKYCIENTKGMAKDIEYAKETITSNKKDYRIAETIYKRNPNAHMYFFIFSLSGGTSFMSPYIMIKFKEYFPNKIVNAIVVKPHREEDLIMHYNARKSLENIETCMEKGWITNLQVLDNNSKEFGEKLQLNKDFSELFNEILTFDGIDTNGNLDEEEFERLFSTNGMTVIHKLDNGDIADNLNKFDEETIYANFIKNPNVMGLILNKSQNNSLNRSLIREVFGIPGVTHDTIWKNDYNIVISTGMSFNKGLINECTQYYNEMSAKKKEIEQKINDNNVVETMDLNDSILSNIKRKTKQTTVNSKPNRRRRQVGIDNETLFKL